MSEKRKNSNLRWPRATYLCHVIIKPLAKHQEFFHSVFHSCPLIPFLLLALSYLPNEVTCHLCEKFCKYGWTYPGMMDEHQEGIRLVLCLRAWYRPNVACCMERQAWNCRQTAMWPRGRVYSPNTAQASAAAGRGCRGGLAFVRVVACFKPSREAFEGGHIWKGDHSARNRGVI